MEEAGDLHACAIYREIDRGNRAFGTVRAIVDE
jgi:hypothetical protein